MLKLSDEQFEQLTVANRVRLELTAKGELVTMPPTGGENGNRNAELEGQLWLWNRHRLGKVFDSSTGFRLPNGAIRSPDVSWIKQERWEALTPQQRKKFLPLCPDFAVELVSAEPDRLEDIRQKMQEYIDNGLRLGWLIAPQTQTVEIYRPKTFEVINLDTLSGEDVLPGFVIDLQTIWE